VVSKLPDGLRGTVSPYMHAFVYHLHELIEIYKDIVLFTLEGSEKFNDSCSTNYFKGSNFKDPLYQVMNLRNRLE
jgi:hypothetical protein